MQICQDSRLRDLHRDIRFWGFPYLSRFHCRCRRRDKSPLTFTTRTFAARATVIAAHDYYWCPCFFSPCQFSTAIIACQMVHTFTLFSPLVFYYTKHYIYYEQYVYLYFYFNVLFVHLLFLPYSLSPTGKRRASPCPSMRHILNNPSFEAQDLVPGSFTLWYTAVCAVSYQGMHDISISNLSK